LDGMNKRRQPALLANDFLGIVFLTGVIIYVVNKGVCKMDNISLLHIYSLKNEKKLKSMLTTFASHCKA